MSGHDEDERPIDRSLIDAAFPVLESSETDKARVRRAVLAAVAGGAALASTAGAQAASAQAATPAAMSGASTTAVAGAAIGGAWKIAAGVVALAAVVGAVSMATTRAPSATSPAPSAPSAVHDPVEQHTADVRAPAPVEPSAPAELAPEPAAPPAAPSVALAPPARERATPTPAAPTEDDVREEARLIAQANAAIDRHDGAAALAILGDYARRYPDGQLREERFAARIFALCETGDETRARAEARSFLNVFPASAHVERIRASCAGTP